MFWKINSRENWRELEWSVPVFKAKKEIKSFNNTGYPVTHPSTNYDEQGLTLSSGRNMLLSLWYSDSTLHF